jgi:uncharacterized membrane protein YkvA (DUF1232 family)
VETWQAAILVALIVMATGAATLWLLWRAASARTRALARRVQRLPGRAKLRLAIALFGDPRMPLSARFTLAALVVYLAMPLDLVPDFVPVLGQLDDVLVLAVGIAVIVRSTPLQLLEEHLSALEAANAGPPPY